MQKAIGLPVRISIIFLAVSTLAGLGLLAKPKPRPQSSTTQVKTDELGGVVRSSKGPEPGVWVIAETSDLPTTYAKIVVTDDSGRYLIPELPNATYDVWVRGYGLVDSAHVKANPGRALDLTAKVALSPKDAAQYYPADYWFSLLQVPDESEFPMKPTPAPKPNPKYVPASDTPSASADEELSSQQKIGTENQQKWIDNMKEGCQLCHQLGDFLTRDLSHLEGYHFASTHETWATRLHFGQLGPDMSGQLARYVDQERAIKMFSDWSDRIANGELPPVPRRPQGMERNVVLTSWEWGTLQSHTHDEISTDPRHPTVNANGLVWAADSWQEQMLTLDPVRNVVGTVPIPTRQDISTMPKRFQQVVTTRSPFFGSSLVWKNGMVDSHNPMLDEAGRVWITANINSPGNQDFCKAGSDFVYAKYFPLDRAVRKLSMYDPETKKFTFVDTCFSTHHLQFANDKDDTLYFSDPGGDVIGWVKPKVLAQTGDEKLAQGWCPGYLDTKGDGKIDPAVDKRISVKGYGLTVNPVDGSVWFASTGVPGRLVRMTIGSNPPFTCKAEVYEPPFNNPKVPGVMAYSPRGIGVDSNGVIWTALSGSSQLASFDRNKCKVTSGPTATGQHCPEGWTLYTTPGPRMKGVTEENSADYEYYNWVDQHNTLGLGENTPIVNGTDSDSLEAFLPDKKQWVVMRVPYPMGFYTRGMDGRIDNPNDGWKGRGVWATEGQAATWHMEGATGAKPRLVKFQIRPNPLAD